MDGLRSYSAFAIFICIFVVAVENSNAHPIDPVDMCILTCDRCFKGDPLLNCANHCISSNANVDVIWKVTCPLFNDSPTVQQI